MQGRERPPSEIAMSFIERLAQDPCPALELARNCRAAPDRRRNPTRPMLGDFWNPGVVDLHGADVDGPVRVLADLSEAADLDAHQQHQHSGRDGCSSAAALRQPSIMASSALAEPSPNGPNIARMSAARDTRALSMPFMPVSFTLAPPGFRPRRGLVEDARQIGPSSPRAPRFERSPPSPKENEGENFRLDRLDPPREQRAKVPLELQFEAPARDVPQIASPATRKTGRRPSSCGGRIEWMARDPLRADRVGVPGAPRGSARRLRSQICRRRGVAGVDFGRGLGDPGIYGGMTRASVVSSAAN